MALPREAIPNLVPVDTDLSSPSVVPGLIPVSSISAAMQAAAHRLIVFDNCRNNPADGWRQRESEEAAAGGGQMRRIAPDTLILFSTAPGRVALDGPAGENSPFAAMLLRQLDGASVDIQALPGKLRRDLLLATEGRQVLFEHNSYERPFLLNGVAGKGGAAKASVWASDPSKIIELPNTYAFLRQNGGALPSGFFAHRAPSNSRHSQKVGAFKYDMKMMAGGILPQVLVVLSVEEQDIAEAIQVGSYRGTWFWQFYRCKLSGDSVELEVLPLRNRFVYEWKEANSGRVSLYPGPGLNFTPYTTRFTRLDG